MRIRASCLLSIIIIAFVHSPLALAAVGLYADLPSFFAAADTSRALIIVRQSECELVDGRASLLSGEVDFRLRQRYEMRLSFEFPAVRRDGEIVYGAGDVFLNAASRFTGDSLDTGGLFLRTDARIPTGSKGLRPFSYASLECGAGIEARGAAPGFAVRGAVLYTLVGERPRERVVTNDNYLTLAASMGASFPKVVSVTAGAFLLRFNGGATRQLYLLAIDGELSRQLVLALEGSAEAGGASERVFDYCVSLSLRYRFPARSRAESGTSDKAPVQNAISPRSYDSSL